MQYDENPILFILNGNNTIRALLPLLSLGKDTARLSPKLSTSSIARKTNLVGQTKPIVRRELQILFRKLLTGSCSVGWRVGD